MTLHACSWPIEHLLPHAAPMILLDRVLGYDTSRLIAEVVTTPNFPFVTERGLPIHVGIELMAQACGAFAGCLAVQEGAPAKIGLLLGTRRFVGHRAYLPIGARIEVRVDLVVRDADMAVFGCSLHLAEALAAEAQLSVYQPQSDEALVALLSGKDP
jgi:predicted hotdog family 3-hydroxylacyl-ACP dehydratase